MEDKDVGVLWTQLTLNHPNQLSCDRKVEALIRKLVEESAAREYERDPSEPYSIHNSLKRFGIDPKKWPT